MNSFPNNIPTAPSQWHTLATKYHVGLKSIFEIPNLKSGSKIETQQFLALHVIWKEKNISRFKPQEWGFHGFKSPENIPKDKHLDNNKYWNDYLERVEGIEGSPDLGSFDMLWEYQQNLDGLGENGAESSKVVTPRRSKRIQARGGKGKDAIRDYPLSPSVAAKARKDAICGSTQQPDAATWGASSSDEEQETPPQEDTRVLYSPVLRGDTDEYTEFSTADDEQIVNTALILLLQGVCLRAPDLGQAKWTLQRKAFCFAEKPDQPNKPNKKSVTLFQARTDGHLRIKLPGLSRSLAILEVKAKARAEAEPYMQESAQMAAWIQTEPDMEKSTGTYQ